MEEEVLAGGNGVYGTNKSGDEGDSLEVVGFFVLKAKIELQCWFQFSDITIASSTKGRKREILPPVSNTKEEKLFQDN